ncbi:MAG: hypothetical protein OEV81_07915 [Betaproteobacteria bacterium]|nr:hypothetical protein [Betaproteobacteria bacterium]MDH5352042.1 hypothetical protein [Betaproteobacteria bacterium]
MRAVALALLLACAPVALAAAPDLAIEMALDPPRVYVGEEARLTLRLLRAPGVAHGALRPPALGEAADLTAIGRYRRYELRRAGAAYWVTERVYAVVPRSSGRLVVPGAALEDVVRYGEASPGGTPPVRGALRGPRRVLEVRPIPAGATALWLPARALTLEETWSRDPAALAEGMPVTRTLILTARGIAAERLPPLEMPAHPALGAHHDRAELATEYSAEATIGRRVQRIVLVPLADGTHALPALAVRWWDVGADAPRVATLEARSVQLRAALPPEDAPPAARAVSERTWLKIGAGVLTLLLAAALWAYARGEDRRVARSRLRAACRRNDACAARDALLDWWNAARPDAPLRLVQRLGARWDDAARAQLAALDAALYAGRAWDGKAFWSRVRPWLARETRRRAAPPPAAPPTLFRLQPPRHASDLDS